MDIPRPQEPKTRKRLVWGGIVLGAVLAVTVALARLEPAAPVVERATLWLDTVRQGPMLRQVRGAGALVPERARQVSAVTSGRVERILVQPGDTVRPGTVLVELSNPDLQLQALQAEQQLAAAEAQLVNTRSSLESQMLSQEATVARVKADYQDAERQARAAGELAAKGLIAEQELRRSEERAEQLRATLAAEQRRLEVFRASRDEELAVQQAQVDRLRQVVAFQRSLMASLAVRAGAAGVLRDLPLEEGQWVLAGTRLATVVQPGRLKAQLRVPETQARDVMVGQVAMIDLRTDTVRGRVSRVDPASQNGAVTVDITLEGVLPRGARPDLSVDGVIELERVERAVYVGRPSYAEPYSTVSLFRLDADGRTARRVPVRLGRASVNQVEILEGLRPGDVVILSDMAAWEAVDRVRIR